jgi:uncharacterized membrane protein
MPRPGTVLALVPGMPAAAFAYEDLPPITTEASATLPIAADIAYEVFADAAEATRWMPILQSARVLAHDDDGRPIRVAFSARLERGAVSYTLQYAFDDGARAISWRTASDTSVQVQGDVSFTPLSAGACLMSYRLSLVLPVGPWIDTGFEHHPASAVVGWFREHLRLAA